MATITLKNIPEDDYKRLKEKAKNNQRSLNGEILFAIKLYLLKQERMDPEELIRRAREIRSKVKGMLTEEEIEKGINEGRP